jgi:Rha family phage regulatory protein
MNNLAIANEMTALGLTESQGKIVVSSRDVARVFEKNHYHVTRDIREIMQREPEFGLSNFGESSYVNEQNKVQPMFLLTRDGFSFLAMGFTGVQADKFKIAYIQAFNAMEEALRSGGKLRHTRQPAVDTVFRQRYNIAKILVAESGMSMGIALSAAMDDTEKLTSVSLDWAKPLLPARTETEPVPNLNATKLGAIVGLSAQDTNLRLAELGLQTKVDKSWRLTEKGKQYGEEFPFTRNGHSDYRILWRESAAGLIETGGAT